MRLWLLLLGVILLAACGPRQITRADLEAVLYQDGDTPAGWTAGQFRDTMTGSVGPAELVASRVLTPANGLFDDEVGVAIYADHAAALAAFETLLPGLTDDGAPIEVGDTGKERGNIVGFVRCRALAVIRLTSEDATTAEIATYARRLDERLRPMVC